MEVLTKQEFLEFIISICMYTSIFFLVFTLIFNLDICLEIVGEFIGLIFKRAKDWIWKKTHKKDDLTHEPLTLDLPCGYTIDEASEAYKKAMEMLYNDN